MVRPPYGLPVHEGTGPRRTPGGSHRLDPFEADPPAEAPETRSVAERLRAGSAARQQRERSRAEAKARRHCRRSAAGSRRGAPLAETRSTSGERDRPEPRFFARRNNRVDLPGPATGARHRKLHPPQTAEAPRTAGHRAEIRSRAQNRRLSQEALARIRHPGVTPRCRRGGRRSQREPRHSRRSPAPGGGHSDLIRPAEGCRAGSRDRRRLCSAPPKKPMPANS